MSVTVVVDGGRTGCRAACVGDGRPRAPVTGPGVPWIAVDGGAEAVARTLAPVVAAAAGGAPISLLVAGVAGLYACADRAPELARAVRAAARADRVVVTGDIVIAHAGALAGAPGVVVAAGTGAVSLGIAADGGHHRVDGWGSVVGDAGSGFAIGRAGLDSALRAVDGRGGSDRLAELAAARYGDLDGLGHTLHRADNAQSTVAAFAMDVAAAARAGDPAAMAIWTAAADELAASAAAAALAIRRTDERLTVSWAGSLFGAGDLLTAPFAAALARRCPWTDPRPPAGTPLDGATWLAHRRDRAPHAGLCVST